MLFVFFFKQKTADEMRISDWSSDVCSSDLLVGGETAEMPGMYEGEDYDLAGFCVGVVEKSEIIDGSKVAAGDALIALPSSGPHSNEIGSASCRERVCQ